MKKLYTLIIVSLTVGSISIFNAKEVFACTPIYKTPQEAFSRADVVFTGRAISVNTSTEISKSGSLNTPINVVDTKIKVEKYWKGSPPEVIDIRSKALAEYSCSNFLPKAGEEYLVYAYKNSSSTSYVISYTDIKEVSMAQAEITALGVGSVITNTIKESVPQVTVNTSVKGNVGTKTTDDSKANSVAIADVSSTTSVKTSEVNSMTTIKSNPPLISRIIDWIKNLFN